MNTVDQHQRERNAIALTAILFERTRGKRRGYIGCPNCTALGAPLAQRLWYSTNRDGTLSITCSGPCKVSMHTGKAL